MLSIMKPGEKQLTGIPHNPDGREIDAKSLLQLVKDVILITNEKPGRVTYKEFDNLSWCQVLLTELQRTMQDMSKGVDKHTIAVSVLTELTPYTWDAKAVIVLASFAMSHGLWMLAQMYSASSPALKGEDHHNLYSALSCRTHNISDLNAYYFYLSMICSFGKRPKEDQIPKPALTILFQALVKVVECIIDLVELPSSDLQGNDTQYEIAMENIPITVYHIINIVIYCTALTNGFPSNDYEISEAEEHELSSYASQLRKKTEDFTGQIRDCNKFLDDTKVDKTYQIPVPESDRTDNRKALEFLIKGGDDRLLRNDADKTISQLKQKYVMLLVSDEESKSEELYIMDRLFREVTSRPDGEDQFSILWIPLYSRLSKEGIDHHFKFLKKGMKWFTVPHPSMISKEAAEFIKNKWQFQSKTIILVMLDPQGIVLNINAFHMISIWGSRAFPFTRSRERALWKSETFKIGFVLNGIEPTVLDWIRDDKFIFLYGGDDVEWIRKFSLCAKSVARKYEIPMELLYVGKPSQGVHQTTSNKIQAILTNEKLSSVLPPEESTWFFWSRLRSMLISKMSHQRGQETEDRMTRQLKWLLGYETARSWALLGKANAVMSHGLGNTVLQALIELDEKKFRMGGGNFEEWFLTSHEKAASSKKVCCQVEFPILSSGMPETMRCPNPNCKLETMDKRIVFECCHPRFQKIELPKKPRM